MDGKSIDSAAISGNKASLSLSAPIPGGTHALTANWPGNLIYSAVILSETHQIEPIPSSVTLSSSLNPAPLGGSVTFTASLASTVPVPDRLDSITFYDGQTQLGTVVPFTSGLTASFTTSNLGIGPHSIAAVYSGNSSILGSTSSNLTESVNYFVGDFSIQTTPATAAVAAGRSATLQLNVTPSGSFSAPMAFSCSGLPALATCVFSPSTLSSGQGQVSLSIHTVGSAQSASSDPSSNLPTGGATAILAGLVFCLLPSASRRIRLAGFLAFAVIGLATLFSTSCGGHSQRTDAGSTPTGSYNISVTAQTTEPSQNISHFSTITLTVR